MTATASDSRWAWTRRNVAALIVVTAAVAGLVAYRMAARQSRLEADLTVTGAPMPAAAETINPNTAGWASLARLPGIGPGRAKAICSYRETADRTPAFARADDLTNVPGIGETIVEQIRRYLTFDGAAAASQPRQSVTPETGNSTDEPARSPKDEYGPSL